MLTTEDWQNFLKNPEAFLRQYAWEEAGIQVKTERIRQYRAMAESITAPIKDTPYSSGGLVTSKVERCVVEIETLSEEIRKQMQEAAAKMNLVKELINYLGDPQQRLILEARFVMTMRWEDISRIVGHSVRWVHIQKKRALATLVKRAEIMASVSANEIKKNEAE